MQTNVEIQLLLLRREYLFCLPLAPLYSMQNFQWLCLVFFLSDLPLPQGYEVLHVIPFLKNGLVYNLVSEM